MSFDGLRPSTDRVRWRLRAAAIVVVATVVGLGAVPAAQAAEPEPANLIDVLIPGDGPGRYPTGRYIVGYKAGGLFDVGSDVFGMLTELLFALSRIVTRLGLWTVEQAYSFGVVDALIGPAVDLAHAMQRSFVGAIGLNDFAVFLAVFYSGWQLLRRRAALGLSELVVSLMIAAVGAAMVANPGRLLENGLSYATQISGAVLDLAVGTTDTPEGLAQRRRDYRQAMTGSTYELDDGRLAQIARPLTSRIHSALIDEPYDLIAFGGLLGDGTPCARARDQILGTPSIQPGTDEARDIMRRARGCEQHAQFNERATPDRVAMAGLSAIVALVVVVLLALVAVTVLVAQLVAAGQLVVMPFAILAGTIPGGGRRVLWRWASGTLQAFGVIVAMSFLLALLIVVTAELLGLEGVALVTRFLVLLATVVVIFRARRRIVAAIELASNRVAERLVIPQVSVREAQWQERRRQQPGDTGTGLLAPAAAAYGLDVLQTRAWNRAREAARTLPARKAPARKDHSASSRDRAEGRGRGPQHRRVEEQGPLFQRRRAEARGQAPQPVGSIQRPRPQAGPVETRTPQAGPVGKRTPQPEPERTLWLPRSARREGEEQSPRTPGRIRQSLEGELRRTAREVGMIRSTPRRAREAVREVGGAVRTLPRNTVAGVRQHGRTLRTDMREELSRAAQQPSRIAERLRQSDGVFGSSVNRAGPTRKRPSKARQ